MISVRNLCDKCAIRVQYVFSMCVVVCCKCVVSVRCVRYVCDKCAIRVRQVCDTCAVCGMCVVSVRCVR